MQALQVRRPRLVAPQLVSRVAARFAATLVLLVALSGCGPGAGNGGRDAQLTISRRFGTTVIKRVMQRSVPGAETALALLQREAKVGTAYGGSFVSAIDGFADDGSAHLAWFYYVNGTLAPKGAAATTVRSGDRVWWDFHDWRASEGTPAVIGSYPAPFTAKDASGHRYTTVIECGSGQRAACDRVRSALAQAGANATIKPLSAPVPAGEIKLQVATAAQLANLPSGQLLAGAPAQSGVYARFGSATGGSTVSGSSLRPGSSAVLSLENPAGQAVRSLSAGAGLIAATSVYGAAAPTWVVTGTDASGVSAAAAAFTAANLQDRFAIAVTGSQTIALPLDGGQ